MISNISNVVYPRQSLSYCLEDKLVIGQDGQKHALYEDRAEILYYNQCFGTKEELIQQFNEVVKLNQNVKEPIFHISLSLHERERISKSRWIEISRDCAREMGFDQNQFVTILHKDKLYQHIHIVANRIGFDRGVAGAEFTIYRLSAFCNEMEVRHDLKRTLHPWQMSSDGDRQTLRKDQRLDGLKETIQQTLKATCDYPAFEAALKKQEIKIYKNEKGIAFLLDQRVVFKGSEAGYPWKKIEAILRQNQELKQKQEQPELLPRQRLAPGHEETEEPRLRHRISHHL
jgi:hypothetical protein